MFYLSGPEIIQTFFKNSKSQMQSPYDRLQLSSDAQTTFIEDEPKIGYAKPSKPIVPELCLESIWIESIGTRCVSSFEKVQIHIFIDFFVIPQRFP